MTRVAALLALLNTDRFRSLSSIIVYVHLQRTADEVMFRLRAQGVDATSYHAGKDARTRRLIQDQFMSGKVG
jgi:superfamily II DNA helicase RecQ